MVSEQRRDGDAELARKAAQGNAGAFEALVERYRAAVESVALARLRKFADAQDVVQETFVRAHRSLNELREPDRVGPWLLSIARNLSMKALRKSGRLREVALDAAGDPPRKAGKGPGALGEALDELAPSERELLLLHHFDGLEVARIAQLLDVPAGTVKRRLHESRGRLREILVAAGVKVKLAQAAECARERSMNNSTVTKCLNLILLTAVKEKATRIVFECKNGKGRIAFTVGGKDLDADAPDARGTESVQQQARLLCYNMVGKSVDIFIGGVAHRLTLAEAGARTVLEIGFPKAA